MSRIRPAGEVEETHDATSAVNVLLTSPYHGGSHAAWAEGYRRYSAHRVELLTLPSRFWKWRMHGGALTLARRFLDSASRPDVVVTTDMLDLTTFLALTRERTATLPVVLYMHENQLTYPLPEDPDSGPMRRQAGERDRHYGFINFASMAAADRILFNSHHHLEALFEELPRFLGHFPEYKELGTVEELRARSSVLPVGIDCAELDAGAPRGLHAGATPGPRAEAPPGPRAEAPPGPLAEAPSRPAPLVLWNQRWEYDKNPAGFFAALDAVAERGANFRLALCGERFSRSPEVFDDARRRLADRIIHVGFAPRSVYLELLWRADVTISTAHHEFFGISVLEAAWCQTFPLVPRRLSYPELLPVEAHDACLYEDHEELLEHLDRALAAPSEARAEARRLRAGLERFDWRQLAPRYDRLLAGCARSTRRRRL